MSHLLRTTFRCASAKYWGQIARDIRPVYTATTEAGANEHFTESTEKWGARHAAITQLSEQAWRKVLRFLNFVVQIRRGICSTSAAKQRKARCRRAKARGHVPTEQAAMDCRSRVTRPQSPPAASRHDGQ